MRVYIVEQVFFVNNLHHEDLLYVFGKTYMEGNAVKLFTERGRDLSFTSSDCFSNITMFIFFS